MSTEWKSGASNVLVVVRARPLSRDERARREEEVARITDGRTIEIRDPGHQANNLMRQARLKTRAYAFDHAFAPTVPTAEVYACTTKFLVAGVMEGYNATVFAYGATGSGKTHTMLGNAASPGLMPCACARAQGCCGAAAAADNLTRATRARPPARSHAPRPVGRRAGLRRDARVQRRDDVRRNLQRKRARPA